MATGTVRWCIVPDEAGGDLYVRGGAFSATSARLRRMDFDEGFAEAEEAPEEAGAEDAQGASRPEALGRAAESFCSVTATVGRAGAEEPSAPVVQGLLDGAGDAGALKAEEISRAVLGRVSEKWSDWVSTRT